ncbi:HNH endonuclease [Auraticoccus monumenti]|uniref:HNH endonuclease n=1 Tax=Auraticoccus monumenti TaxID=675864 RepID=A0A1G7DHN6_9ACTN|nr:HNH endonuclease signature motif containing protein [Auraticoccus monumenti]SDE50586.1 HNH endonuclease [Auraticoccus monumenti]
MVAVHEVLATVPQSLAPVDPLVPDEAPGAELSASSIGSWTERLAATGLRGVEPAALVDVIRALEGLKCAAEAVQAAAATALDRETRAEEQRQGVPAARQGRGVAAQVALARRESPARGRQHLGLALVLDRELPHTFAALRAGRITEWRATLLARETACLSREHRREVDQALAADADRLEAMGEGELVAEARARSYRLDPEAAVQRRRRAEAERRVSLRPAPDTMSQLSALLPVKDGVAVHASLCRQADAVVAAGDGRSRGQIMADTLVERILGTSHPSARPHQSEDAAARSQPHEHQASGGAATDGGVGGSSGGRSEGASAADTSVMIHLLVSDSVLFGAPGAGHVDGYGPVPGDLARQLATADRAWIRRLYTTPTTGELIAAESRARRFPPRLAQLVRLRDRTCRTPWCDAPIRHTDHIIAASDGGTTSLANGQGLCEACNYAKESPGWTARPRPGPRHTAQTTTPTGHGYQSTAPPPLDPLRPDVSVAPSSPRDEARQEHTLTA